MFSYKQIFPFMFSLLLLAACNQEPPATPLPTLAQVAALPTNTSTPSLVLPPTQDLTLLTPTAAPPTITSTPRPTATATPVEALLAITEPDESADLVVGTEVVVSGLGQKEADQNIVVSLVSSNNRLLAENVATLTENSWQAALAIPIHVTGAAYLSAKIQTQKGDVLYENRLAVNLVLDASTAERYLALFRPVGGDTAVSGFNIFFDGEVFRPAGNTITIAIWENCQTQVARQTFVLGTSSRSFYWQGFVVVPEDLAGPACAVASFGEPGAENWREAQFPITVLPQDDANAKGVLILNPPAGDVIIAGQQLFINGTAFNVSEGPVSISLVLENGRILNQTTTLTDYWGYWETSLILPVDTLGIAQLTVTAGELGDSNYAESQTLITIAPAPTPTRTP